MDGSFFGGDMPLFNKRVLLVNPPLRNFREDPCPPLGLAYLASVVGLSDFEVEVFDMPILTATVRQLADYIQVRQPGVVGIGCVASSYLTALEIARVAKAVSNPLVVLGGPHATFVAEQTIRASNDVDAIVRGEGELTLVELTRALACGRGLGSIHGLTYKDPNGRIRVNPDQALLGDLDEIPFPARHHLPMGAYRALTDWTSILTSRGCAYNCIYCSSSSFWCHRLRSREASEVIREMKELRQTYGFTHLRFVDDNLLFPETAETLLQRMKDAHLDVRWSCNARVDLVTKDMLQVAAETGCIKITYGIESCSERVLRSIGKDYGLPQIKNAVNWARELGIEVKLNFILGLPHETREDVMRTIALVKDLEPASVMFGRLTPYPGTEIANNPRRHGVTITQEDWWRRADPSAAQTDLLSNQDLDSLAATVRNELSRTPIKLVDGY